MQPPRNSKSRTTQNPGKPLESREREMVPMVSSPAGVVVLLLATACLLAPPARPFSPGRRRGVPAAGRGRTRGDGPAATSAPTAALGAGPTADPADGNPADAADDVSRAPSLNGKTVMPARVLAGGLRGHTVPAVYAVLSSDYKRG